LLAELQEHTKEHYVSAVNLAKIYLGLNENDRVLEFLEKACLERSVRLPWFIIDTALDGYRDNPRFREIVRRVGLPQQMQDRQAGINEPGEAHTVIFSSSSGDAENA
jgi:hypothetical protein